MQASSASLRMLLAASVAVARFRIVGGVDEGTRGAKSQVDEDLQEAESCNDADTECFAVNVNDERCKQHVELLLAVQRGDVQAVRGIFDANGPYKISELDKTPYSRYLTGITPTSLAARAGNSKMMELLLANGGTTEVKDPAFELTTLHHAVDGCYALSIVGESHVWLCIL